VATFHRKLRRDGYGLQLISLAMEGDVAVTGTLLIPDSSGPHQAAILADARAKETVAALGGDADTLAREGFVVLTIQPRGTPEKSASDASNLVGDFALAFQAYLVSRSLTGLRAEDIIRSVDFLTARPDVKREGLTAIGYGAAGVYVLHAAALDARIARVVTQQSPALLRLGVERPIHRHIYEVAVPGMLARYDLDSLIRAIAPRRVTVVNPVDLLDHSLHASEYRGLVIAPVDVVLRGRRAPLPNLAVTQ
jgi:hypothetical protein